MKINHGFSLLEITIVLLIVGLLLAGILGPLAARIEQKERQRAQEQLEDIRDALLGFAITNGRLPCPDTDGSGLENHNGTSPSHTCTDTHGELPWSDLHIPEFDPWGLHFVYHVTGTYADGSSVANTFSPPLATCLTTPSLNVTFALCTDANIQVLSGTGVTPPVMDNIPAIVVSKGKHNLVSEDSTDEAENYDNTNNELVLRTYSMESGNRFDDLMIWISPNILKNRMVQAGRLP